MCKSQNSFHPVFVAMLCTLALPLAGFAAASSNEGGEYNYTNVSPNDNRTTGQTGDQIYNVLIPISKTDFYPGQNDIVPYWQIYRGAAITGSGKSRLMKGNVVFENEGKWTGNATDANIVGYLGPAKLLLRNGGSLTCTATHLRIGQQYNATTTSYGTLFMEEPSALTLVGFNLIAGNSNPGTLWVDGGRVSVTNGVFKTGGTDNKDGYIRINGGEVSLGAGDADFFSIGSADNYGSLHISGGTVSTRRTGVSGWPYGKVGDKSNRASDIYIDGSLFDLWNERFDIGNWNSGITDARATFTVDGDGRAIMNLPVMGRGGSGNKATVNLNGGRFELTRCFATYGNTGNSRCLNFDGGTLALVKDSRTSSNVGELDSSAGNVVVYPGGAMVDVPSEVFASSSATFRQAQGYGVSEITLTNPGSGYVTAPKVTIAGGVGSNATAYAVLNKDRTLEKIVVTCRGEGYAANDSVTVTISSATGSGAAATATLASNEGGILRKTGDGTLRLTGDNAFGGEVEIAEGAFSPAGGNMTSASTLRMGEGTILRPIKGTTSSLNRLDVTNGIVQIRAEGDSGTATLTLGELSVNQGLALVTHTNGLALALSSTASTATSSSSSPVVNGLVYARMETSGYRSPSLFERAADGTLSVITTTSTIGADANWCPSANSTYPANSVNSIIMPLSGGGTDCYVENSGLVEVKSGMIIMRRPQEESHRMSVSGGGAFTTRAKDGMFIYADLYQGGKRSRSEANGKVVYFGNYRRLLGPFADPDANTPMALTVAGEKKSRPEFGAQAWLLGVQTFSGGLNLVNGGVFIQADSGLGASGSPVRASGYCSIASYNWTFDITHPIQLLDGSALIFSPYSGTGNTVSSALSGSGDLLTSDVNRPSCAMAFTGDHSAFTGNYYIQGRAQIAPATFSPLAGIKLADGTDGVGVIETTGSFTRPAGTGKGELCWKPFSAYPASYGLRGGFSAFGGDLMVNLGGEGAKLSPGSDYLPDGAVIQLQSQYADGDLTFANGFELGGKTQAVNVWSGKTATIAGAVSDEVGDGKLDVTGNLAFAGTIEVDAANVGASPFIAVDGDLSFEDGATVRVDPAAFANNAMAPYETNGLPLATATGTITGLPTLAASGIPDGWYLVRRNDTLLLKRKQAFLLIVR